MRLTSLALYSSLVAAAASAHINVRKADAALFARDALSTDATNVLNAATNGALQLLQTAENEVQAAEGGAAGTAAGTNAGANTGATAAQANDDSADTGATDDTPNVATASDGSMPGTDEVDTPATQDTGSSDGGDTAPDPNLPSDGQLDARDPHNKKKKNKKQAHHRSDKHAKSSNNGDKKKKKQQKQKQNQPEPKKQNKSSGGGGGQYHGKATYFNPGLGACGGWNGGNDKIVALSGDVYAGGSHCGKGVRVCRNGKCVPAQVVDLCPGCHLTSLDLSPSLFAELAPMDLGLVDITWSFT